MNDHDEEKLTRIGFLSCVHLRTIFMNLDLNPESQLLDLCLSSHMKLLGPETGESLVITRTEIARNCCWFLFTTAPPLMQKNPIIITFTEGCSCRATATYPSLVPSPWYCLLYIAANRAWVTSMTSRKPDHVCRSSEYLLPQSTSGHTQLRV